MASIGAGAVALATHGTAQATIVGLVAVGKDGWLFPAWDEVRKTDFQHIHKVTEVIIEAVGVLKKAGMDTILSVTPAKSRIYREFLPDDFRFSPDADRRYTVALEDLRKGGVLVPDLATLLMDVRKSKPNELVWFKTDTHWTPAGAEPAGIELAKQIAEKFHLPAATAPGTQLGDYMDMIQTKNDLAEIMPPAEKSKYPGQTYKIRKMSTAQGQAALVDDDAADVVVIGNSFTQPKYGLSAVISAQLHRPVALAWKVHQFGPYFTMLDYFKSASFKAHRPRVIVWDFEETDMEASADRKDVWGQSAMAPEAFLSDLRKAVGA